MDRNFDKEYFYGNNSNYNFLMNYEMFRHRIFWIDKVRKILKYKKKGKLLDIGCAFGYFASYARKKGFDVYGVDISKYAIEEFVKKLDKNKFFVSNAAKKLPFKNSYFDVVTAFDVIEHVKSYEKAIKNICKVLRKDGFLFLSMPIQVKGFLKFILADKDITHVSILTEGEIKKLLERNGLEIQEIKYYYLWIPIFFRKFATSILVVAKKH